MSLYGSSLWHNYNSYSIRRLRVAYNDAFRMIHGLPRHTSASVQQIFFNVHIFDALIRKSLFSFVKRCRASTNFWINALMNLMSSMNRSTFICTVTQCMRVVHPMI